MLQIVIFHSEFFSKKRVELLRLKLVEFLDENDSCVVRATGETVNEVFYMLQSLKNQYPKSLFTFFPSTCDIINNLSSENIFDGYGISLIELDIALTCEEKSNLKYARDKSILKNADIIIYSSKNNLTDAGIKKFHTKSTAIFISL
ncbi:MAG: hypothetical protein IKJ13_02735 [Clostridia bacterium]|nr:hypothetical protein [Clostridia bacterium]